jgi:hypothetical protein|tara:strand:- start:180 stop:626 length:447 start_codon:yes stop_codon:yes gene_type:complete
MKANEFVTEIKASDLDLDQDALDTLKKEIDPADSDDAGYDKEFKSTPMIVQLGKVLDSASNPNPIKQVVSDSGKKFPIKPIQAQTLKMFLTTDAIKPDVKRKFTADLQTNDDVLGMMLDAKDQKEMVGMFKAAYMSDGGNKERSAYTG